MLYAMNTRTTVPTHRPQDNEFGHDHGCTFVYLQSTNGLAVKVWVTYGDPQLKVGQRVSMTNDTGLGHRSMADHIVLAVMKDNAFHGKLPAKRRLPLWVAK